MTYNAYRHAGFSALSAFFLTLRYALHSITKRAFVNFAVRK
jgi:hypothetical protein